jgi:hypothetical protein
MLDTIKFYFCFMSWLNLFLFVFQLIGFVISCVNVYIYADDDESCKYLSRSTYNHPSLTYIPVLNRDSWCLPSYVSNDDSQHTYKPASNRDSWCQPSYVSYADSQDWSNVTRTRSLHGFTNSQDVTLSPV